MNVLIIDGQGGKLGRTLTEKIRGRLPGIPLTAVGTNSAATAAMLKGGADAAATGENSVIVTSRRADVIIGPIGIVIADSMLGEITPAMALAVAQSRAVRILIPVCRCDNIVAGTDKLPLAQLIDAAVEKLAAIMEKKDEKEE